MRRLDGRAERLARGRALRKSFPRSQHARWIPPRDRPSPIALLEQSHERRLPQLEPVRWGRMVPSAFGFFRGSAMIMAWDLAHSPHSDVYVQACGDAHLGNFGISGTPERRLIFDLRDFDETLPAPWEWDIKRLAASLVVAARDRGMSQAWGEEAVLGCVAEYRRAIRDAVGRTHMDIWYRRVDAEDIEERAQRHAHALIKKTLAKARKRTSAREVKRLTEMVDGKPRIKELLPLVTPFNVPEAMAEARAVLDAYASTMNPYRRVLFERYHLVDVAYRVVGVGSVGTRCLIVLLCGDAHDDPLFLQLKEAGRSVLEPFARPCSFANQGERVVQGQRLLQAASDLLLGWTSSGGRDFYVRQLKDMKGTVDVSKLQPKMLVDFGRLCGVTLAQAHARSGDFCQIAGYLGKSDQFDRALAEFAELYADQVERDHSAFYAAVRAGRLPIELGA